MTIAELADLLPGAREAFDWGVVYPPAFGLSDLDPLNHRIANVICHIANRLAGRPDLADALVATAHASQTCPVSGKPLRSGTDS